MLLLFLAHILCMLHYDISSCTPKKVYIKVLGEINGFFHVLVLCNICTMHTSAESPLQISILDLFTQLQYRFVDTVKLVLSDHVWAKNKVVSV